MKKLTISQEGCSPVVISDDDDSNLEEYTKKLSDLLRAGNVSILHTNKSSTIIRPSKITSIIVEPIEEVKVKKSEPVKKEKPKVQEDIITDID